MKIKKRNNCRAVLYDREADGIHLFVRNLNGFRVIIFAIILSTFILSMGVSFAYGSKEEIEEAKAALKVAEKNLQNVQIKKRMLLEKLTHNPGQYALHTIVRLYMTTTKFHQLENKLIEKGKSWESEAVSEFEQYTGYPTGEEYLVSAYVATMEHMRKGTREAELEQILEEERQAMEAYRQAKTKLAQLESPPEWPTQGPTNGFGLLFNDYVRKTEVRKAINVMAVIQGGRSPFRVFVSSLNGLNTQSFTQKERGLRIPFMFQRPGYHTADLIVEDESLPRKSKRITIEFRVRDPNPETQGQLAKQPTPSPPKKPQGGEDKPKPGTKVSSNQKPPTTSTLNPVPLEGNYEAELWPVPGASYMWAPISMIISINRDGNIKGQTDWTLPDKWKDKEFLGGVKGGYWKTRFKIDGALDRKSGEVWLKLFDMITELGHKNPSSNVRSEIRQDVTFYGWRLGESKDQTFLDALERQRRKTPDYPSSLVPPKQSSSNQIQWQGFAGWPGGRAGLNAWQARVDRFEIYSNGELVNSDASRSQQLSDKEAPNALWILRILRPASSGPAPSSRQGHDLVGLAIWPHSTVVLWLNETIQFDAIGVYADDVYEPVDMTAQATWNTSKGLVPVGPGKGLFKGVDTGKHWIEAKVRDQGMWSRDIIEVVILASPKSMN